MNVAGVHKGLPYLAIGEREVREVACPLPLVASARGLVLETGPTAKRAGAYEGLPYLAIGERVGGRR